MFRKYVIVVLAMLLSIGSTACTSKKAEEGSDIEVASTGDDALEEADAKENNDDLEGDSGGSGGSEVADLGGESDDLGGDDGLDGGSAAVAENAGEVTPNDLSETPPAESAGEVAPPADEFAANDSATPTPDAEAPPPDMAAMDSAPPPEPESTPAPPIVPEPMAETPTPSAGGLKKINATPYKQGKIIVNAVYLARDGDTVESIGQKVGSDVKQLCKINSYNCGRGIKVGDKYYYNSPQRPEDDTVVKTYYEDNGIPPEIYTAKAGDNIRAVAKELLGHDRSWMEIWATNDVESKGDLDEGTQLKYWPASAAPTQTIAAADTAAPPAPTDGSEVPPPAPPENEPADAGTMPTDAATAPPPPADAMQNAQNDLPPSPDPAAAGSVEPPPPPPPPPPPTDVAPPVGEVAMEGAQDPDQTLMLGFGAVLLLAAAALFISIRKKRQRRQIDFNTTTQTQIE